MPSWKESRALEEKSIPIWLCYFENNPNIEQNWYVDDKETQTQDHWDIILILKGKPSPVRVDVKTRAASYYQLYQKDNLILIEVQGNVGSNLGSSIFNSNAELWAYGWLVDDQLKSPLIFNRKKFADWFKHTVNYFPSPKNSNTSNLYETKNKLVPRELFKPFEVNLNSIGEEDK